MTEIEIKAHVADHEATERAIAAFAVFRKETIKRDAYWKKPAALIPENGKTAEEPGAGSVPCAYPSAVGTPAANKPVKVRIREEDGEIVVTYKRKELQGDIEVNDEREFSISDRPPFEVLLGDLGFEPYITKEKKTRSFSFAAPDGTTVTIELSLVTGLGWFVELEILADNPDREVTLRAQEILRAALKRCEIPETAIEPRYYTDMLAALNGLKT